MPDQNQPKPINTLDDLMSDLTSGPKPEFKPQPSVPTPPPQPLTPQPRPQPATQQPSQQFSPPPIQPSPSRPPVSPSPAPVVRSPLPQQPSQPRPPEPQRPAPSIQQQPNTPSIPQAKPAIPTPNQAQSPQQEVTIVGEYQSSIRTMKDDLSGLKRGQKPSGVDVQKRVLKGAQGQNAPTAPASQQVPAQALPGSIPQVSISEGNRASSFLSGLFGGGSSSYGSSGHSGQTAPGGERSPKSWEGPTARDPRTGGAGFSSLFMNRKLFLMIMGGLVGLGVVMFVLPILTREPDIVIVTPTPRPSRNPSSGIKLPTLFGGVSKFDVPLAASGSTGFDAFYKEVNSQNVAQGQFRVVSFTDPNSVSTKSFSLIEIFDVYGVKYPSALKTAIDGDSIFLVYGQKEVFATSGQISSKRMVVAGEIKNSAGLSPVLTEWTKTMLSDLNKLFAYEKQIPASQNFLEASYRGVTIKYVNFSLPDLSLDYAIVPGKNGKDYLVFANSRESMFEAVNRIRGQ